MWHKGGLRFVNVYLDICRYLHTESCMCTIVFIWIYVQISAHICTKAFLMFKFRFYEILWREKFLTNIFWLELDFGLNYCFHMIVNETWWLTDWCDGWRRTSSLNSKVLWMSTTYETSPGKVRESHFASTESEQTALSFEISSTRQVQEGTSTSMSAAWKSCHSSVDFCC